MPIRSKEDLDRLDKMADALMKLGNFCEGHRIGCEAWFAKKFVMKNFLGLSDAEIEENNKMMVEEKAAIELERKKILNKSRLMALDEDFAVQAKQATDSCESMGCDSF